MSSEDSMKSKKENYAKHREYVERNREKIREYHKEYYARPEVQERRRQLYRANIAHRRSLDKLHYHRTRERHRDLHVSRRHGISVEEYRLLLAKGVCDICGKAEKAKNRCLSIDHCHSTNRVRGLLCGNCNKALGGFKDDVTLLSLAINYLKKYAKSPRSNPHPPHQPRL